MNSGARATVILRQRRSALDFSVACPPDKLVTYTVEFRGEL